VLHGAGHLAVRHCCTQAVGLDQCRMCVLVASVNLLRCNHWYLYTRCVHVLIIHYHTLLQNMLYYSLFTSYKQNSFFLTDAEELRTTGNNWVCAFLGLAAASILGYMLLGKFVHISLRIHMYNHMFCVCLCLAPCAYVFAYAHVCLHRHTCVACSVDIGLCHATYMRL
jgi:hypothetical protein